MISFDQFRRAINEKLAALQAIPAPTAQNVEDMATLVALLAQLPVAGGV